MVYLTAGLYFENSIPVGMVKSDYIPLERHYKPQLVYFYPIFSVAHIVKLLLLQTIYVLKKEIVNFWA